MSRAIVEVWRGAMLESQHRVSVAVVDASGCLRAAAGEARASVFARSAVKPLQALPLVEDGAADRFGLTGEELALCCGSHGGERFHVVAAESLLGKIGADESALACGAHAPWHPGSARALEENDEAPRRIHNNCSGKHLGMLALARHHGWPIAGYERADHPVQGRILAEVARWTELPAEEIVTAVDGCGVVTFGLPLDRLAGAFARLAAAARRTGAAGSTPAARVVAAMTGHPEYVAGTGRLCTRLMRVADGRVVAKAGAEGVYCAGVPGAELGIALKVEDGARRAAEPALLAALRALGLLSDEELAELAAFATPDLRNTRDEVVGRIRADLELGAPDG